MRLRDLARLATLTLPLAACAGLYSGEPPDVPPVRAERIPAPPGSRITQIWQPGHWDWDGQAYLWADGEWVPRAGHGPLWQDGFWRRLGMAFVWVPAHWL